MVGLQSAENRRSNRFLSNRLIILMAVAGGLSVANLYYNQPLLGTIANEFHITPDAAGSISMFTQFGYALGIFFFGPIGDIWEKKKLMLILSVFVVISLLGISAASSVNMLYGFSLLLGMTTILPQIMVPMAAQLAKPEEKGKAVGMVVSGLLLGILLARTFSGYMGYLAGWRCVFALAAGGMCLQAIVLYFALPAVRPKVQMSYHKLLQSVFRIACSYREVRLVSISGAMLLGAFNVFWATMAFFMESPVYSLRSNQIGLFGLLGAAGALGAPVIGRMSDKSHTKKIIVLCIVLSLLAYAFFDFAGMHIWGMVLGVILLDFGVQGAQVDNQTRLNAISVKENSRINTIFVSCNFCGAALGSLLGALAWNNWQWSGVCIVGSIFLLLALFIHLKK